MSKSTDKQKRIAYIRLLGCLGIKIAHLDYALVRDDYANMDVLINDVEITLAKVLQEQRFLNQKTQKRLRKRFLALRQKALGSLNLARQEMDESLKAIIALLDIVEQNNDFSQPNSPGSKN